MSTPSPIFDVMTIAPPEIAIEVAAEVARMHWGVTGTLKPLSGERDANFYLAVPGGDRYVLKFANPAESADFRAMQVAALDHIAVTAPDLAVPRVIPTLSGAEEACAEMPDGVARPVRLLSWIDGLPIGQSRRSAMQRAAYGRIAARLQIAMRGFNHPGAATPIIWDLQHAMHLHEAAFAVRDPAGRAALEEDLASFEAQIVPVMPQLRRQVLHDDLNRANVLVDPAEPDRITGVIDFGDTTETALIFDLAIAAVSQQGEDMDIVEAAAHMLSTYAAVCPIPAWEAALLPLLMRTRLVMSFTLGCWHRFNQPGNHHHLHNEMHIARSLMLRSRLQTPQAAAALMAACGHH